MEDKQEIDRDASYLVTWNDGTSGLFPAEVYVDFKANPQAYLEGSDSRVDKVERITDIAPSSMPTKGQISWSGRNEDGNRIDVTMYMSPSQIPRNLGAVHTDAPGTMDEVVRIRRTQDYARQFPPTTELLKGCTYQALSVEERKDIIMVERTRNLMTVSPETARALEGSEQRRAKHAKDMSVSADSSSHRPRPFVERARQAAERFVDRMQEKSQEKTKTQDRGVSR